MMESQIWRRRISRSLVTALGLSLFTFGLPGGALLSISQAVTATSGGCTVDGTNTSNFSVIDSLTADGTCMVRFTAGTSSFTIPTEVNSVRTLAVGGGGAGGWGNLGGGGGAGSVIYSTSGITGMGGLLVTATIGAGGIPTLTKTNIGDQGAWGPGRQGETTTLTLGANSFHAVGGGGGGGSVSPNGIAGGSGGGSSSAGASAGAAYNVDYALWTEAVKAGYRNASYGGGGGGAGAAATNGNGAIGVTVLGYLLGGGGAGFSTGTNTSSKPYGGGAARDANWACLNDTCLGTANTGGGGGAGGDGGSGVALVKYIPARGQGSIAATRTTIASRTHSFVFTDTNAASTGITRTYQWQEKLAGSSTWNNVTGGTGATTTSFTTAALMGGSSGNTYRIGVIDTNATLGISTTTYTTVAGATLDNLTVDYALNFTGVNESASAADNAAFDLPANFTFEAWVYPTDVSVYKMVANKEESYMFYIANGYWTLSLNGTNSTWSIASNNVPAIANEWHHIAITKSSSSANYTFYYDGEIAYTGAADTLGTAAPKDTTQGFTVGSRAVVSDHYFKGKIDNVAGFGAVRTQAQVQADMNNYIAGDATGLRFYYDFNEGSGTTAYNHAASATSATNLTLTSSSLYEDVKTTDNSSAYAKITFKRTYITPMGGWQSPNSQLSYTSLVVAGGGAGGARVSTGAGGGGGAGGMVESGLRTVDSLSVLSIRVGQGGLGERTGTMSTIATGNNGQNSFIKFGPVGSETTVTAIGGGGGAGGYGSQGDASYNGSAGGSGGGASGSNVSGYVGGSATQTSSGIDTGYGNAGGGNPGCSNNRPGGGGGGAGSAGQLSGVCTLSGNGGSGRTSTVTGLIYAGGGGAGKSGDNGGQTVTPGSGGSGGGASGGGGNLIGSSSELLGEAGTAGTGGGGGGVGISAGTIRGGAGGSGVVVIRFLSTAIPIFDGPVNDTTTAGLTYTFEVTGDAPSPFVRTYRWQKSTDTGTSWSAIDTGTGFTTASYTTPILETTTSGSRYQYRVVVTDTDTGTVLSGTSTGVWLIINARITITGSYTTYKYGVTHTDTFTVGANTGTGTKTIKRTSTAKSHITWDTSTANIARVTVAATLPAGTYYDTLTVTDIESATAVLGVTITVLKADTVTVIVASRTDTYTASSLSYVDTHTVTGLVAGDSLTSLSYAFSGTANDGTAFNLAARPAIAGTYSIIPIFTLANAASYESVTVTNGTLTINRKIRTVTINTKPTALKYGETSTVIASTSEGTSDGSLTYATSTSSLCAFTGAVLQAIDASGNCSFTSTMTRGNNYETATSSASIAALSLADTITVTVQAITPLTYTASQAAVTPKISIAGLVYTDTATATSATFSYNSATTPTSFTSIKPTNSDTYTVRSETLTLTSGSLSKYLNVVYVDGTLRINRAQQGALIIPQYVATFGTPYRVLILGGSGTGQLTETVTAGTASGCVISGDTVTTTTQGTCLLSATKAQDQNYETATVSGYIYFLVWITNPAPPTVGSGPTIALNGAISLTRDPYAAPSISAVTSSGDMTYPVAITGEGFASSSAGTTTIKFWRNKVVAQSDFIIKNDGLIWTKQPAGASTGKVMVINNNGIAASTANFTPLIFNI